MLVDLADDAVARVRRAGYRVAEGSLGKPQRVPASPERDDYLPVQPNGELPSFAEQEVVIVQQRAPDPVDLRAEDVPSVTKDTRIWATTERGVIDTRPLLAQWASAQAQRILDHGGIFVFFCDPHPRSTLVGGQAKHGYGGGLYVEAELDWTVWNLLPELDGFNLSLDHGEEIAPVALDVVDVLAPHLASASFTCTLSPGWKSDRFIELAHNKYGQTVAGTLVTEEKELSDGSKTRGWAFLLPRVRDVGACLVALLDDVLPALRPALFPESDRTKWVHSHLYELPSVRELQAQIEKVRKEAKQREQALERDIVRQRELDGWTHTLLTGMDEALADAVKRALDDLGLKDVRKVDDKAEARATGRRREDLQIWGESPVVLVEVKGLSNLPREIHPLQVTKYLIPRMRQWDRRDVRGLAVINQQRGLPALDRENVQTFQQDILDNAEEQGFGLITTLDLFRLVRNKRRWDWPAATVVPLLYADGRIHPIPTHYEPVGVVDGFFEKVGVVAITVTGAEFSVGDELAFRLPIDYEQQVVESIRMNDNVVDTARRGDRVGVKTLLTKEQARNGVEVYRVAPLE